MALMNLSTGILLIKKDLNFMLVMLINYYPH